MVLPFGSAENRHEFTFFTFVATAAAAIVAPPSTAEVDGDVVAFNNYCTFGFKSRFPQEK